MASAYELVVFDWEGTLGDPLGYILQIIQEQGKQLNLTPIDEQNARKYITLGLERALKKSFPSLTLHQYERLLTNVQHALQSHTKEHCLFSGARQLVERIHQSGIHLAIATNKGQQSLQRALQVTGMDDFFSVIRCAGQVPAKPCPQMLEEIMAFFAISADKTLMIGDSVTDVEMANALNVACIGLDFYHQHQTDLQQAGASFVFDNYTQVGQFLKLPGYSG